MLETDGAMPGLTTYFFMRLIFFTYFFLIFNEDILAKSSNLSTLFWSTFHFSVVAQKCRYHASVRSAWDRSFHKYASGNLTTRAKPKQKIFRRTSAVLAILYIWIHSFNRRGTLSLTYALETLPLYQHISTGELQLIMPTLPERKRFQNKGSINKVSPWLISFYWNI